MLQNPIQIKKQLVCRRDQFLGLTLFLIYINDIDLSVETSLERFEDYAKLYARVRTREDLLNLGNELQIFFNENKFKAPYFGRGNINGCWVT